MTATEYACPDGDWTWTTDGVPDSREVQAAIEAHIREKHDAADPWGWSEAKTRAQHLPCLHMTRDQMGFCTECGVDVFTVGAGDRSRHIVPIELLGDGS